VPYGALQQVADRTVIVDIAIQREDGRPVALQVRPTRIASACTLARIAWLSVLSRKSVLIFQRLRAARWWAHTRRRGPENCWAGRAPPRACCPRTAGTCCTSRWGSCPRGCRTGSSCGAWRPCCARTACWLPGLPRGGRLRPLMARACEQWVWSGGARQCGQCSSVLCAACELRLLRLTRQGCLCAGVLSVPGLEQALAGSKRSLVRV